MNPGYNFELLLILAYYLKIQTLEANAGLLLLIFQKNPSIYKIIHFGQQISGMNFMYSVFLPYLPQAKSSFAHNFPRSCESHKANSTGNTT